MAEVSRESWANQGARHKRARGVRGEESARLSVCLVGGDQQLREIVSGVRLQLVGCGVCV